MTDNDIDKDVEAALAKAMDAPVSAPAPTARPPLRTAPTGRAVAPLSDQLVAFERVQAKLRDELRAEGLRLEHEYRQRREAIAADYDIKISEALAKFEADREREYAALAREFHDKVKDLDHFKLRIGG